MEQFNNSFYQKKSLGQHFLTSKTVAEDLVRAAKVGGEDTVVEVGPGRGFITEELLKVARKVIAVEKDGALVEFLKEKFAEEVKTGQLTIVHDDILTFTPSHWKLGIGNWKLLGAIPYYITGKLIRTVLEQEHKPSIVALIIQKEVAERACANGPPSRNASARQGKESLLSLGIKVFGTPRYVHTVPRQFFSPPPKVSSAIFAIEDISDNFFTKNGISMAWFFKILHTGFAHKRKILLSSLRDGMGIDETELMRAFNSCDIPPKVRPEDMALEKWGCLVNKIPMTKTQ